MNKGASYRGHGMWNRCSANWPIPANASVLDHQHFTDCIPCHQDQVQEQEEQQNLSVAHQ